jgi:hypothetical protein
LNDGGGEGVFLTFLGGSSAFETAFSAAGLRVIGFLTGSGFAA